MVTDDARKSQSRAEEVLRRIKEEQVATIDPAVRPILELDALEEVFAIAWERQFDRDRAAVQRTLRDAIQKSVAEVVEADAD